MRTKIYWKRTNHDQKKMTYLSNVSSIRPLQHSLQKLSLLTRKDKKDSKISYFGRKKLMKKKCTFDSYWKKRKLNIPGSKWIWKIQLTGGSLYLFEIVDVQEFKPTLEKTCLLVCSRILTWVNFLHPILLHIL